MSTKQKQDAAISVRFSPEMRAFIGEQAKKNFRSLSSEIAARLERTRQEDLMVNQKADVA